MTRFLGHTIEWSWRIKKVSEIVDWLVDFFSRQTTKARTAVASVVRFLNDAAFVGRIGTGNG
jgi:hypothetical protein